MSSDKLKAHFSHINYSVKVHFFQLSNNWKIIWVTFWVSNYFEAVNGILTISSLGFPEQLKYWRRFLIQSNM